MPRYCFSMRSALPAVLCVSAVLAQVAQAEVLSAEDSDPRQLGWMQGFPPEPERIIGQPDSNYFSFPKMRWTVCHFRELLPTKQVSRGLGAPVPFNYALDDAINDVTFTPIDGNEPMTWQTALNENYTDGVLILH